MSVLLNGNSIGSQETKKMINYLKDYDAIKGNKIYLDNLKEVCDNNCNINNLYKLKDYIIV